MNPARVGPAAEETFRRLTMGDLRDLPRGGDLDRHTVGGDRLDERTEMLLRIAALIALDAPLSSYQVVVGRAQLAGVGEADLLAILAAVAPDVGSARIVSAAPRIALAAGYDVHAALERNDPSDHPATEGPDWP
jgi:alkylhydroperoxidase/carboxymuconolactone decarboxylase family protein YurZ